MTVEIEVGKTYATENGFEFECVSVTDKLAWLKSAAKHPAYVRTHDGDPVSLSSDYRLTMPSSTVSLPSTPIGPVVTETVTRKRIVPGEYGRVVVLAGKQWGRFYVDARNLFSVSDLTEAIATLTQIRDAMRDAGE